MLKTKLDFAVPDEAGEAGFGLLDLIDRQSLQQIQEAFSAATGVGSVITDIAGMPITATSNFCPVCRIVRGTRLGLSNCEKSDAVVGRLSSRTLHPAWRECLSAGFIDASAPILVSGKHVANWLIGQIKTSEVDRQRLAFYAAEIGADPESLLAEFDKMPLVSMEQFQKVVELLWCMAKELSALGYQNLRLMQEIDKQKAMQTALQESEQRYRLLYEKAPVAYYSLDRNGRLLDVNEEWLRLLGYTIPEVKGRRIHEFVVTEHLPVMETCFKRLLAEGSIRNVEYDFLHKEGHRISMLVGGRTETDSQGSFLRTHCVIQNITERKLNERRLEYLSTHDALTGLYNRYYFEQVMNTLELTRHPAIIICDVDGLKLINDTLGHAAGDETLKAAGQILETVLGGSGITARIGGDEFAIILFEGNREEVESLINAIRVDAIHYTLRENSVHLSLSVGYAFGDENTVNAFDLYKEADNQMYREKLHRSQSTRSVLVQTAMRMLAPRDYIADGHADRLQALVLRLGRAVRLPEKALADMRLLAQFHDIGKVGIAETILFKPGPLTAEEWREIRRHCEIGHRIASSAPELTHIADCILKHHEWWDGSGYPLNLKGLAIPLECRILSIADAYDAMTSDRSYRKALSSEQALQEIERCSGSQFDPELVSKFIEIMA